eukprot:2149773-Rhodomonas_salina.2
MARKQQGNEQGGFLQRDRQGIHISELSGVQYKKVVLSEAFALQIFAAELYGIPNLYWHNGCYAPSKT